MTEQSANIHCGRSARYDPRHVSRPDWKLKPLQVPELPGELDLEGPGTIRTFGRDPNNDIVCQAPSVSGHHARLEVDGDGDVWVEDLGSRNGTYVGGESVVRARLKNGDVFQLGRAGPRFALLTSTGLDETVYVPGAEPALQGVERPRRIGPETMEVVRSVLGLGDGDRVDTIVGAERTRSIRRLAVFTTVLVVVLAFGGWYLMQGTGDLADQLQAEKERQAARISELEERLKNQGQEFLRQFQDQVAREEQMQVDYQRLLAEQRTDLEQREKALRSQIAEQPGSDDRVEELLRKLRETERRIDSLDPIKVERQRLQRVAEVERAVVLIEVTLTYKHSLSGRTLYVERSEGEFRPNFDGRGRRYERESSGSGFVVNEDGWVVTNAHVVHKKGELVDEFGDSLQPSVDLKLIFSNTEKPIPGVLHSWDSENDNDLALIKIEPFEGMPHLDSFAVDSPPPELGTDVFVLGFPLGKSALQPDERQVVASTFRGILSRSIGGDYMQTDAAVHPGNSGGPVIDAEGHVIAVVVGQQRIGELGASDIGYVIPIRRLASLWPPGEKGAR